MSFTSILRSTSESTTLPNQIVCRDLKKLYVLLCSPAHSGSTLVACLGAAHPEISTVGEFSVRFSHDGPCSCDTPYIKCEFWKRWMEIAANSGIQYLPGSKEFSMEPDSTAWRFARYYHHHFPWKALDRLRDLFVRPTLYHRHIANKTCSVVRMAQLLCNEENTSTFLDTSKNALQIRPLLEQDEVSVRFITLVRDGRAAVLSLMKWYKFDLKEAVDRWLSQIRLMRRATRYAAADQLLNIRHEDLVRQHKSMIPRLFEFCGVDPAAELDFAKERRHIVGNAMRHKFDGNLRMDESWRKKITTEQLSYFNKRAGHVNRSLGYLD